MYCPNILYFTRHNIIQLAYGAVTKYLNIVLKNSFSVNKQLPDVAHCLQLFQKSKKFQHLKL